jgi:anti-sigma regulatory factor (Ser/Thr protein kinase)
MINVLKENLNKEMNKVRILIQDQGKKINIIDEKFNKDTEILAEKQKCWK